MTGPVRPVVLLRRRALWDRLEMLNRSQTWLAAEVGISPSYLSRLIRDGRAPSGRIRRRIQLALGSADFSDLFEIADPDPAEG